jgi:hypothetical protein
MDTSADSDLRLLGVSLHQRLTDGDVTAPAEIAEFFLPLVVYKLRQRFPNLYDHHLVDMAADDAFLSYFQHPQQYNPLQLSLVKYLIMSAWGDLLNLLHKSQHLGFPNKTQFVELDASAQEYKTEVKDESLSVEEQAFILASPVWTLLEQLLPDVTDREIALLMLEGIRDTNEYARTLGISHLPKANQETEVKRHKDRIKKTLQRHIDRSELDVTK